MKSAAVLTVTLALCLCVGTALADVPLGGSSLQSPAIPLPTVTPTTPTLPAPAPTLPTTSVPVPTAPVPVPTAPTTTAPLPTSTVPKPVVKPPAAPKPTSPLPTVPTSLATTQQQTSPVSVPHLSTRSTTQVAVHLRAHSSRSFGCNSRGRVRPRGFNNLRRLGRKLGRRPGAQHLDRARPTCRGRSTVSVPRDRGSQHAARRNTARSSWSSASNDGLASCSRSFKSLQSAERSALSRSPAIAEVTAFASTAAWAITAYSPGPTRSARGRSTARWCESSSSCSSTPETIARGAGVCAAEGCLLAGDERLRGQRRSGSEHHDQRGLLRDGRNRRC